MMAKPILQKKNAIEYKQISIKVPVKLHERVLAFRDRLEKIDPELMFNVSAVCQGALEAALKQAEKELDGIEQATKQSGENPTVLTNLLAFATDEEKQQRVTQEPPASATET